MPIEIDHQPRRDSKLFGRLELAIYIIVVLVAVILMITGIVLRVKNPEPANAFIAGEFLKDLGFAGIIAVIIIFTVEVFNKRRQRKEVEKLTDWAQEFIERTTKQIKRDVLVAVLRRFVHKSVVDEMDRCLRAAVVYRKNLVITYTLHVLGGTVSRPNQIKTTTQDVHPDQQYSDRLKCEMHTTYDLHNWSTQSVTHTVCLDVERPLEASLKKLCKITAIEIGREALTQDKIKENSSWTTAHLQFRRDIEIPEGKTIHVSTTAVTVKQKTDMENYVCYLPTSNLTLIVGCPKRDLDVQAVANHSQNLIPRTAPNEYSKLWQLEYGIFPHQSVTFWWSPKNEQNKNEDLSAENIQSSQL